MSIINPHVLNCTSAASRVHDLMSLRMCGAQERLNFADLRLAYEKQLAAFSHMTTDQLVRKLRFLAMEYGEYHPGNKYVELCLR